MNKSLPPAHLNPEKNPDFSIFSYGFRPFFLAAGIYAILALIPWVLFLMELTEPTRPLQSWHAHEMLFGFVGAGFCGFLLSAIPNWTNTKPITGSALKGLVSLWLLGRVVFWAYLFIDYPIMNYLLFLDLLLPMALTAIASHIFITTQNNRNFIFIAILLALTCANLLTILDLTGLSYTKASGAIFATNIIMIAISVIGGRVTPTFTRNYLTQHNIPCTIEKFPTVEKIALAAIILNALIDLFMPHSMPAYLVALLACTVHAMRASQWCAMKTLGNPILWVLHLGYLWMIIALFLKGTEEIFSLPYNLYLHAFTIGTIGLFMIGIMSRASLGHTGRPLIVRPEITTAYILILISAGARTLTPFFPGYTKIGMVLTSSLWIMAFALFLWVYLPILTKQRIDGKPG